MKSMCARYFDSLQTKQFVAETSLNQQLENYLRNSEITKTGCHCRCDSNLVPDLRSSGLANAHNCKMICALLLRCQLIPKSTGNATGKAAARLKRAGLGQDQPEIPQGNRQRLPDDATTIQRLLG